MEQLTYIILLSSIAPILYCLFLYFNLPYKSFTLKSAFIYFIIGILSVGLLFTLFDIFPNWNKLADNNASVIFERNLHLHIKYFVEVGFMEEFAKLLAFLIFDTYRRTHFKDVNDSPTALMVYVGMVSLGFAFIENIIYGLVSGIPYTTIGWRSISAVIAHLFFGLYMGYFIAKGRMITHYPKTVTGWLVNRFKTFKTISFTFCGLFVASMIHGLYDLELVINEPRGTVGIYILFVALTVGIIVCFKDVSKKII